MYVALKNFTDLQDNNHKYAMGEAYPRDGYEPSPERVAELAGSSNKAGMKLIKEVKTPKKKGGRKASKK